MAKTGGWYHGPSSKPGSLDLDSGSETASLASRPDVSPPERKTKQNSQGDSGIGSERESTGRPSISRTASQQGRELKRQYSSDKGDSEHDRINRERDRDKHDGRDSRSSDGRIEVERLGRGRGQSDPRRTPSDSRRRSESADPELRYRHERDRGTYPDERLNEHRKRSDSISSHTSDRSRRSAMERHRDSPDRHRDVDGSRFPEHRPERRSSSSAELEHRSAELERRSSVRDKERDSDRERERHRNNREVDHREVHDRQRNHRKDGIASDRGTLREPEKPAGRDTPTRHQVREMRPRDSERNRNGERKDSDRHNNDRGVPGQLDRVKHEQEERGLHHHREERTREAKRDERQRLRDERETERRPEKLRSHEPVERKPSREYDSRRSREDVRGTELGEQSRPTQRQQLSRQNSRSSEFDQYGLEKSPPLPRHMRDEDLQLRDLDMTSKIHLDPSSASGKGGKGNTSRRKVETMLRNDSLSSDQSECVRPPPPKPHKHRSKNKQRRQHSLSSSDDEIRSTPECTSCDDGEIESESVSEKGRHLLIEINYCMCKH